LDSEISDVEARIGFDPIGQVHLSFSVPRTIRQGSELNIEPINENESTLRLEQSVFGNGDRIGGEFSLPIGDENQNDSEGRNYESGECGDHRIHFVDQSAGTAERESAVDSFDYGARRQKQKPSFTTPPLNLLQCYPFKFHRRKVGQKERRGKRPALQFHGDPGL
jgi:hypothetical protein